MSEDNTPQISVEYDGSSVHYYSVEYDGHVDAPSADTVESIPEESLVDNLPPSMDFEVMAFGGQATVCATAPKQGRRSTAYQSEAELEKAFIAQLQRQAYEYVVFSSEDQLVANLRRQLELLNGIEFTNKEWLRFFKGCIASENEGIVEKTRRIQRDHVQVLHRDDGTVKNVQLIDKRNVLSSFDNFEGDDPMPARDEQDYRSVYTDLYQKWRKDKEEATIINDDLVFEIELLKQVDINFDYILMLVQKYHDTNCTDKLIIADVERAINSSYELRNKRDLVTGGRGCCHTVTAPPSPCHRGPRPSPCRQPE